MTPRATEYDVAQLYFRPHLGATWRWTEHGTVVVRENGWTIAFRAELATILARIAPQGAPPFESILHLLNALREGGDWVRAIRAVERHPWMDELVDRLDELHALPPELRATPEARAELAALAFEGHEPEKPRRAAGPRARAAATALSVPTFEPDNGDPPHPPSELPRSPVDLAHTVEALEVLWVGLLDFDRAQFEHRLRTGLDAPVQPAPLDALTDGRATAHDLEDAFVIEPLVANVARLARDLASATHLPRQSAAPDPSAAGGLSDVGQRGPLERLLASELAFDDATLAARIATNEALYWQRETPVVRKGVRRAILIDVGLRTWGVPRAFAAAVALALTVGADPRGGVTASYAHGADLVATDLATAGGLAQLLGALECDLDPAAALAAFAAEVRQSDATEAVLVTEASTLADPTFAAALARVALPSVFVCTVDRVGRLEITEHTPRGARHVRSAEIALERLFAEPPRRRRRLLSGTGPGDGPAIERVDPFPLYLPHRIEAERAWFVDPGFGLLAVTRDRRLILWNGPARGGRQLCRDLPAGEILAREAPIGDGPLRLAVGRGSIVCLVLVFRDTLTVEQVPLEVPDESLSRPHGWFMHAGRLYGVGDFCFFVYEDGPQPVATCVLRDQRWTRGRLFTYAPSHIAVSYDAGAVHFDRLEFAVPSVSAVIERYGHEGFIGISARGELVSLDGTKRSPLERAPNEPLDLPIDAGLAVSGDGQRLRLNARATPHPYDLSRWEHGVPVPFYRGRFEPEVDAWIRRSHRHTPRTRFTRIYIGADRTLALESRSGTWWSIATDATQQRLELKILGGPTDWPRDDVRPFEHWTPSVDTGLRWKAAHWQEGTTAWLDSRGLLHLKAARPEVPEVSIVLCGGHTAAWASNGLACGPHYFTGRLGDRDTQRLVAEVLLPILARAPR